MGLISKSDDVDEAAGKLSFAKQQLNIAQRTFGKRPK